MAGTWTYTGATKPIGLYRGHRLDFDRNSLDFPTLGASNGGWVQEFIHRVGVEFALECQRQNPSIATLIVSGNNGAGDTNGNGAAIVITLTTA